MKLIKKIAAIMFAFMMVFSLSTNVKAVDGTTGTITIKNAKKGETYTVYKVLTLYSYNPESKLYSYLPATEAWKTYFENAGNQYMSLNDNGYVVTTYTDANAQELAQALIKQAKEIAKTDTTIQKQISATSDGDLQIDKLSLGYYVIDSTVGTLCALTTTNPNATIEPKHEQPTVNKQIHDGENYVTENSVNIGDTVNFETTINVKKGAKNYVLHDQMSSGLTFGTIHEIYDNISDSNIKFKPNQDYSIKTEGLTDGCTFELTFKQDYFDRINQDAQITIMYFATVNENAPIKTAMENKTWLTYGEAQKTDEKITKTYSFGIPVFKYTGTDTPLKDAKFILSTDENCTESTKTLKFTKNGEGKYRYDSTNGKTELVSLTDGMINIEGIKAGTYYLKETEAPKGYNLLNKIQKIEILKDGSIKLNGVENTGKVRVQNNSGSLLPSTGGMGTTLIYLIGGALVLGSGFVLVNKKRAKAK